MWQSVSHFPELSWVLAPLLLLVLAGDTDRLEGNVATGPLVLEEIVPAVERKPFINLRSFCLFFLPPGPEKEA